MKHLNKKITHTVGCVTAVCLITAILLNLPTSAELRMREDAPLPAGTGEKALKEEVVYVRLHNDGSLGEVYVVNSFILDGAGQITDYGNYSYVRNLTNSDVLQLTNGKVSINTRDNVLYYEGFLSEAELPWEFSIIYKIDGNVIPPEELGGKSGHLEMTILSEANPRCDREFFDRYCLQLSVTLDSGLCREVRAQNATVVSSGANKQINFIAFPGKKALMELSAEVMDFSMPSVTVAGLTMNMDMDFENTDMSDIRELTDGIAELDDGVFELLDGMFDMRGGVAELYDGTVEFAEGMEELADGVEEIGDGVSELVDGTEELRVGVSELRDGVEEMRDGADELAEGSDKLTTGFFEFDDGVAELKTGADELYKGITELTEAAEELTGGLDKTIAGANDIKAGLSSFATGAGLAGAGGTELRNGFDIYFDVLLESANAGLAGTGIIGEPLTRGNYEEILLGIIGQATEPEEVAPLTELYMMLSGYDSLLAGLNDYTGGVSQLGPGASYLSYGMSVFVEGLDEYRDGFREFAEGIEEFRDGASDYAEGAKKLRNASLELLDGVTELRDGIVKFRDGVIELRDGVIELCDGIVKLRDGVIELNDGIIELRDGVIELRDGFFELRDGCGELFEGTDELYDGVTELKDGTAELRQNTETLDADILEGIKDAAKEMMGGDGPVRSFVSAENGEINALQFLMQTEGIPSPEYVHAIDSGEPETTFWQRLSALFGRER